MPLERRAAPAATRSSHSALRPVQGAVASVSKASQFAQSHQKPMRLSANLSTLSKYSQSWLQFWTSSEVQYIEVLISGG